MSETKSCWLQELAWHEIEAHLKSDDVALGPIGATEQHGPHLPLLTDTAWAVAAEGSAVPTAAVWPATPGRRRRTRVRPSYRPSSPTWCD